MFGLTFLPLLLVSLFVYPRVLPAYQGVVLGSANHLLAMLSPVAVIRTEPDGCWAINASHPEIGQTWSIQMDSPKLNLLVFLSLAVLPALLAATPVRTVKRLRLVGYGLVLLFILHVLSVSGSAYAMGCFCSDPNRPLCRNMLGVLTSGGLGFAVAIWGTLAWDSWFAGAGITSGRPSSSPVTPSDVAARDRTRQHIKQSLDRPSPRRSK